MQVLSPARGIYAVDFGRSSTKAANIQRRRAKGSGNYCISSVFALLPFIPSSSTSSFLLLLPASPEAAGAGAGSFFFFLTRPETSLADLAASASLAFCVAASAPSRPPSRPWKTDGSRLSNCCLFGSSVRSLSCRLSANHRRKCGERLTLVFKSSSKPFLSSTIASFSFFCSGVSLSEESAASSFVNRA